MRAMLEQHMEAHALSADELFRKLEARHHDGGISKLDLMDWFQKHFPRKDDSVSVEDLNMIW
jgi:hypothetical protein